MSEVSLIIGSIVQCFQIIFNGLATTVMWCGHTWVGICVTFLIIDMVLGFILTKINHHEPEQVPTRRYDAKSPVFTTNIDKWWRKW